MFDGYEKEYNIKDMTHKPCYGDKMYTIVIFTEDIVLFLRNNKINRNSSICREDISAWLYHSKGDADLDIVQKTIECASSSDTPLVGEDTDLLVLLCHHTTPCLHDIFF